VSLAAPPNFTGYIVQIDKRPRVSHLQDRARRLVEFAKTPDDGHRQIYAKVMPHGDRQPEIILLVDVLEEFKELSSGRPAGLMEPRQCLEDQDEYRTHCQRS